MDRSVRVSLVFPLSGQELAVHVPQHMALAIDRVPRDTPGFHAEEGDGSSCGADTPSVYPVRFSFS